MGRREPSEIQPLKRRLGLPDKKKQKKFEKDLTMMATWVYDGGRKIGEAPPIDRSQEKHKENKMKSVVELIKSRTRPETISDAQILSLAFGIRYITGAGAGGEITRQDAEYWREVRPVFLRRLERAEYASAKNKETK